MCILQRYAFVSIGLVALIAAIHGPVGIGVRVYSFLIAAFAVAGGSVSVRQSLLQRFPAPEPGNCMARRPRLPPRQFPAGAGAAQDLRGHGRLRQGRMEPLRALDRRMGARLVPDVRRGRRLACRLPQASGAGRCLTAAPSCAAPSRWPRRDSWPPASRARRRAPRFAAYPFSLGVASGSPTATGFVLWTRLAPAPLDGGGLGAGEHRGPLGNRPRREVLAHREARHGDRRGVPRPRRPRRGRRARSGALVLLPVPRRRRGERPGARAHGAAAGRRRRAAPARPGVLPALRAGLLRGAPPPRGRRAGPGGLRGRLHLRIEPAREQGPRASPSASRRRSPATATATPSTRPTPTCRPRTPARRGS